jgi:sugar lactone lactonase YvrE
VLPGTGTAAAAARATGPALAFYPSPYDFGPVSPGQSASKTFTLSNSGGKATGKLRVRLSGAAAFSITGGTCHATRLRPGKTCTVTVQFAPSQAGRITATLTAASKGGPQHAATASDVLTGGQALGAAPGQIYWVSADEIWAANLDGTSSHAIVTGQIGAEGIAVNSSHLYWADTVDGTIREANLNGASPHTIVTGQRGLAGLAATSSHIYWANDGGGADRAGTIWTANLDGSSPHAIVTGQTLPAGVAADASHVYWADEGNETAGNGTISEANPDGSSPHVIVTGQTTPSGVAVDASHLYWASIGDGTVNQASLDGSSPHAIVTGQNSPSGVASDASHLYWASTDDGTVNQASPDGSSPHAIVTGQNSPSWMAVTPAAPELSFSPAPYDYGSVPPDRQQGRRSR